MCGSSLLRKVLRWYGVIGTLAVPENLDNVVAVAALEQLKAIDAASEGGGIVGVVAGLVGAPDGR
jgi:hypothetical protein